MPFFWVTNFTIYNSPAAIVKIKTNGDLCALGDGPQWVDVQMQHAILNDVPYLRGARKALL